MNFEQAKLEYLRLKESYEKGELNAENFERAALNLRVTDKEGQTWQIGLTSGSWYRREGARWIEDSPTGGGTATHAERTFFGAPVWLAMAVGGAGVLTILGVFAISLFFLLNSGAFPAARVITATFGPTRTSAPMTLTIAAVDRALTGTPSPEPSGSVEVGQETAAPVEGTETAEPAQSEVPLEATEKPVQPPAGNTPAGTPTKTRTPKPSNPNVKSRVWKSFSYTNFDSEDAVQNEWTTALDLPDDEYDYVNYKNRLGLLFTFVDPLIDITPFDEELYNEALDIEIEEVLAFPAKNDAASVDLTCRNNDWYSYYYFNISRTAWYLSKYEEESGDEVLLDEGSTPSGFQNGDWGRLVMRCDGSQITVWMNGAVLTDVEDDTLNIGTWTVSLYLEGDDEKTSLYFASHRVYKGTEDAYGEELDRFQLNDVDVTLDRGWRTEGDAYSLGLSIDNRSGQSQDLKAEQVYLLGADGTRYPAVSDPPQNTTLPPFRFPYSVKKQQVSTGSVYFRGLDDTIISDGLELVVDLSDWNLGQARFELPTE